VNHDHDQADVIRQQMARLRRELNDDVSSAVGQAKDLLDWRQVVRRHPLMSVSAAAAVGFLAVPSRPSRPNVAQAQPASLKMLAAMHPKGVQSKREGPGRASIMKPVVDLIAAVFLRKAVTIVADSLTKTALSAGSQQRTAATAYHPTTT
jgi:hypothetical protein